MFGEEADIPTLAANARLAASVAVKIESERIEDPVRI